MNIRKTLPILLTTLLSVIFLVPASGADKNKDKDKEKAEKPDKVITWDEVRTAHFIVASDGGDKLASRVAEEFEQLRGVFQLSLPNARLDNGIPTLILAAKDGKSFATVFPEFPVDKRREQPTGMFVSGEERDRIALRTNASGEVPYHDIYREYARKVLKLSYRDLPPWLELGYASIFENMSVSDKGAVPGRLDPEDLSALFRSPLLPLDLVFHVDRNSAYYSTGGEPTVYSAESRTLVHYLISDPEMSKAKSLDRYVDLVEKGTDSLLAARQVFGDLNQLQNKLEVYFKQRAAARPGIPGSGDVHPDAVTSSRTLTPAELEARLGDFSLSRGRFDAAETKLENAIMLDPSLAFAEESMGFLQLRQNQPEEAQKHFERASQIDSKSALTYYGLALTAMAQNGATGVPPGAVANFEKAVALDPEFASAWFNLAALYALRPETMPKALPAAQRAATLAPGESGYQHQVAAIQEQLGRKDTVASITAQRTNAPNAAQSAVGPQSGTAAIGNTGSTSGASAPTAPPPSPTTSASGPASTSASSAPEAGSRSISDDISSDRTLRIQRKTEPGDQPTVRPRRADPTQESPNPVPPPAISPSSRIYSMIGTITDVVCKNLPQVLLTLKAATIVMHLHADDVSHLPVTPAGTSSPAKAASCAALRGHTARISYQIVSEKSWDGEIQMIEFRNQQ